ncbi:unnamed protein product [Sphagnum jensenii]|uniref:Uncharacterized protein n=1 Tax=Sphagnum jensenii TaxID=128206 RepID=A0ABP0VC87_9BRYO
MLTLHSDLENAIQHTLSRIESIQPGTELFDNAMNEAATAQLHNATQRIHTGGIVGDGSDIGQYSAAPIYVNPEKSPVAFSPLGKTGNAAFAKSGRPHLTRYFDGGYRAWREQIGLPADRVVLSLRGDLRDGLSVIQTGRGYGLGWADESLCRIARSLEDKYGKRIWSPTEQERAEIVRVMKEKLLCGEKASAAIGCDTISNLTSNDTLTVYLSPYGSGYLSGNNSSGDLQKGEQFNGPIGSQLTGAFLGFGWVTVSTTDSATPITINAYNESAGAPDTVITSTTVTLAQIAAAVTAQTELYVSFPAAPTLTANGFFISVVLPTTAVIPWSC